MLNGRTCTVPLACMICLKVDGSLHIYLFPYKWGMFTRLVKGDNFKISKSSTDTSAKLSFGMN